MSTESEAFHVLGVIEDFHRKQVALQYRRLVAAVTLVFSVISLVFLLVYMFVLGSVPLIAPGVLLFFVMTGLLALELWSTIQIEICSYNGAISALKERLEWELIELENLSALMKTLIQVRLKRI